MFGHDREYIVSMYSYSSNQIFIHLTEIGSTLTLLNPHHRWCSQGFQCGNNTHAVRSQIIAHGSWLFPTPLFGKSKSMIAEY